MSTPAQRAAERIAAKAAEEGRVRTHERALPEPRAQHWDTNDAYRPRSHGAYHMVGGKRGVDRL